ncbi:MAG: transcriptional regulator NrdR [Treponema sp.]
MRCPYCGCLEDKVVESRTLAQGGSIRRRRECLHCGCRFTSYEHIDEKPLMVIKRDKRREPFNRTKLERGIERSLEKRPISMQIIENIVNEIEDAASMSGKGAKEITSTQLGEMVLAKLYHVDKVAYIRFASVYKQFNDLDEFIYEVKKAGVQYGEKAGRESVGIS